ncbi:MAG: hypothetical protein OEY89_02405 [Gammaproteobacteria bacterium]|nr:hypothetical protein [Gammaproteobacteria bacterium]
MARDGSGNYSLPQAAFTYDTVIDETAVNSNFSDIATALSGSLAKNGETVPTGNLPMGTYKFTGLGVGSANTDSLTLGQAQNSGFLLIGSVSGVDTITGALTPAITAYATGQSYKFISAGANTTAVTLNLNSVGAKDVTKNGTTALVAGDIPSGALITVTYDGTRFQLNALSLLNDTTPKLSGALNPNSNYIGWSKGADVASASPCVLGTDGNYFDITGTTGFSAFTVAAGILFAVQFDGALTLTHGASLNLPGAANITTAAGDEMLCYSTAANTVRALNYTKADGTAVVAASGLSSQVGAFTRDISTATGTQAITGVGFQPTALIVFAAGGGANLASWGMAGSDLTEVCTNDYSGVSAGAFEFWNSLIRVDVSSGNVYIGALSTFDADGFTISWTKTGSPTGTIGLQYIAFK